MATHPPDQVLPEFEDVATYDEDGYSVTCLHLDTHCETHMDALAHLFPTDECDDIGAVSPTEMITEGVVLDWTDVGRGEAISRQRLRRAAESASVSLEPDDFLVLDTGMDPTEWSGADSPCPRRRRPAWRSAARTSTTCT